MDNSLTKTVAVGCQVEIESHRGIHNYEIVNDIGNPLQGKISKSSPIGLALLGKKVGDNIRVKINSTSLEYKLLKIK